MNNPTQVETGCDPSTGHTGTDETLLTSSKGHITMNKLEALIVIREVSRLVGIQKAATVKAQTKVGENEGTRLINGRVGDGCSEEKFEAQVNEALGFDVASVEDFRADELAQAEAS